MRNEKDAKIANLMREKIALLGEFGASMGIVTDDLKEFGKQLERVASVVDKLPSREDLVVIHKSATEIDNPVLAEHIRSNYPLGLNDRYVFAVRGQIEVPKNYTVDLSDNFLVSTESDTTPSPTGKIVYFPRLTMVARLVELDPTFYPPGSYVWEALDLSTVPRIIYGTDNTVPIGLVTRQFSNWEQYILDPVTKEPMSSIATRPIVRSVIVRPLTYQELLQKLSADQSLE